jgi:trk system potassium uptake protein
VAPTRLEQVVWGIAACTLAGLLCVFNYTLPAGTTLAIQATCYLLLLVYVAHAIELVVRQGRTFFLSQDSIVKVVILGTVAIVYRQPYFVAGLIILEETIRMLGVAARTTTTQRTFDFLQRRPALLLSASFLSIIGFGSILLSLPLSTHEGQISFLDAVFTATSATCVTGLVVQNTGTFFTGFGQGVILMLMQVGGLGIMVLSTALALVIGKRLSVEGRMAMQHVLDEDDYEAFRKILRNLFIFTLWAEGLGTAILTMRWYAEFHDFLRAFHYGLFHAVSAFCNAGFAFFPDSFIRYQSDPVFNLTLTALILVGGIGFAVIFGLTNYVRMQAPRTLNLHVKLTLWVTGGMLVGGMLFIFLTEFSGSLRHFPLRDKLWVAWFQSVTLRTAGFNTIDLATFADATIVLCALWMFIGGSPGSTAGGIKTTTVGVLLCTVRSMLSRRTHVEAFGRTIPWETIQKSISITFLSGGILALGVILLLFTNAIRFREALFEAISAVGTVGLSLGATAQLTPAGKLVITMLMFVGRVGPLTIALLMGQARDGKRYHLPEDKVIVG